MIDYVFDGFCLLGWECFPMGWDGDDRYAACILRFILSSLAEQVCSAIGEIDVICFKNSLVVSLKHGVRGLG